jgi:hypothetical protein
MILSSNNQRKIVEISIVLIVLLLVSQCQPSSVSLPHYLIQKEDFALMLHDAFRLRKGKFVPVLF